MCNLVDPEGFPTRKATWFMSNSEFLVYRLRQLCDGSHKHGTLEGAAAGESRCKRAQVWPIALCRRIVQGLVELKQQLVQQRKQHSYPADVPLPAPPALRMRL